MRILISAGIFPNRYDSNRGIYILKQAVALQSGNKVRVIAPVPYFPGTIKMAKYSRLAQIPRSDRLDGVDILYPRYFVIPKLLRFLNGLFVFVSCLKTYRAVVREFKPDVILGFWAYPYGFASVLFAKLFKLPVAVGVLGSDINRVPARGIQRRLVAWTMKECDRVFTVSTPLKNNVVRLGADPARVVVIPNGIDKSRFRAADPSDARSKLGVGHNGKIVLCVSRLSWEKGIDVLINAFNKMRESGARLVIIGDGDERSKLEGMVRDLELEETVQLLGAKENSEVALWMNACDVVALSSRFEGHPNVLIEAFASGRGVVATRVGGVPDVIVSDSLGLLVEPEDPDALASALSEALTKKWDRDEILKHGVARTWDDVASDIVGELDTVLVSRASGRGVE